MHNIACSIGLSHRLMQQHVWHGGMRRWRCGNGTVHAAQTLTVACKHSIILILTHIARGSARAHAQTFLHAHAAPLRTDDHGARMRLIHARLNSAPACAARPLPEPPETFGVFVPFLIGIGRYIWLLQKNYSESGKNYV